MPNDALDFYFSKQERRYTLGSNGDDIAQGIREVISALPQKQRDAINAKIDKVGRAILEERAKAKIQETGNQITNFFNRNPIALFALIGLLIFKMGRK